MDTLHTDNGYSNGRIAIFIIAIILIIAIVIISLHLSAKSSIASYAQSQEFSIYPKGTLISKDEICPPIDMMESCITTIFCTDDDISDVVAYLEKEAEVEDAPENAFGSNAYLVSREGGWLDQVMFLMAGKPRGEIWVQTTIFNNKFSVEARGDQTQIRAFIGWTQP